MTTETRIEEMDAKKFARLEDLARQLNSKSDTLNTLILELEDRLNATKIGVSAWLDVEIQREGPYSHDDEQRRMSAYSIGFCRMKNGEWHIATRKDCWSLNSNNEFEEYIYREEPVPLTSAPRAIRADAARYFDRLVDEIFKRAEAYIENIDTANRLMATDGQEDGQSRNHPRTTPLVDHEAVKKLFKTK